MAQRHLPCSIEEEHEHLITGPLRRFQLVLISSFVAAQVGKVSEDEMRAAAILFSFYGFLRDALCLIETVQAFVSRRHVVIRVPIFGVQSMGLAC